MANVQKMQKETCHYWLQKALKVQSLFNGENPKLNLHNLNFVHQHVKIPRLTTWLDL